MPKWIGRLPGCRRKDVGREAQAEQCIAMQDVTPFERVQMYADVIRKEKLKKEREETLKAITKKGEEAERKSHEESLAPTKAQQASVKALVLLAPVAMTIANNSSRDYKAIVG